MQHYPEAMASTRLAASIGSLPKLKGLSTDRRLVLSQEWGTLLKTLPESPWYPQTGPQALAYLSDADELFFGGSAGGGKSDLIIGMGLTAHLSTLILRTESTQLQGIKARIQELLRPGDRWQGIGPHGGVCRTADHRLIELNGCESFPDAVKKYRGRPHDLKAWDELPTFPEAVYTFVNGWNRTVVPGQRCRVVGAGNPPSRPEEEWVLDYWAPWLKDFTAEAGQLVWYARVDGKFVTRDGPEEFVWKKETIRPRSRTFIPARLEDNPILEKTGYREVLQLMPEPYRSQLLYGDMEIGKSDDAHQLIPTEWIVAAMERWRPEPPRDVQLTAVGVDPARGGKDRSVVAKRYGNWIAPLYEIAGKQADTGPKLAPLVLQQVEYIFAPIIIDITGTAGGGLYDSLTLISEKIPIYAFVAAGASAYTDRSGRLKMRNKRTEAYWRMRDALDPENDAKFSLPPDRELKVELAAQRWYMYSTGAGLEEKDEVAKRLGGKSPDKSDAVVMTLMDGLAHGGWVTGSSDVDPSVPFMGTDVRPRQRNTWV